MKPEIAMSIEPDAEPDIVMGPLKIWIAGRQFPNETDYWDGNWLQVEARCASPSSRAKVEGPIVHLSDLRQWLGELRRLRDGAEGVASLACTEPEIAATVQLDDQGSGELVVALRQCRIESHEWTVEIDRTYLPAWISALEAILSKYPIRGKP